MNVTRNVILDVLPLYTAGEVSADTRALVDEYLAQDLDLAQKLRSSGIDLLADRGALGVSPSPGFEARLLRHARGWRAWQRRLYAWATAVTLLALVGVFYWQDGGIRFRWLPFEHPEVFGGLASMATSLWISYWWVSRRLSRPR